ncbi:MAG: Rieske 2Fe-2S domain-containing protein [Pseudonocardiaceae bacterium]|nr:Rieske 2Fe-2S domain-containing protein [Pseudonocardiaceae bacterium]
MTPEQHSRRDVLAVGALAAGAVVTLAACNDGNGGGNGGYGGSSPEQTSGNGGGSGNGGNAQALASLDDIPVGDAIKTDGPDGEEIIIARPAQGEAAAFGATCTHQGCKVAPEAQELKCPCHGSAFDKLTGEVRSGPAERPLPKVNVRVRNGQVLPA